MARTHHIYETGSDRVFTIVNYTVLSGFLIVVLYPLIYVVSASFSSGTAIMQGKVWLWPVRFSIDGYTAVFRHRGILSGYANSIFYATVGTSVNIVITLIAAYPLSRKDFPGRGLFMFLFAFTMLFNGGLIPTYLVVKDLGLINTRLAMIIPNAVAVWNVIITRTYFQTNIPDELLESAHLDGCSDLNFVWRIVMPLSKPIVAVIALFYAVGHWNAFFNALIYLNDPSKFPLQLILRDILVLNEFSIEMISEDAEVIAFQQNLTELLKYSLIVVASVPVLIAYPFVQRFFVKGIMVGSLKG